MRQGSSRMPVRPAGSRAVVVAAAGMLLGLALALPSSCSDECSRSSDCPSGQMCVRGSCEPVPGPDADADGRADADTDVDVPGEDVPGADADGDDVPIGPDGDAYEVPDTAPVCDCTSNADCPTGLLPCFYQVCNPATHCCDDWQQVPSYCASGPGATYCEGGTWCLDGVEMEGTDGVSRCTDTEPPEADNCAPNAATEACELTVARTCPW